MLAQVLPQDLVKFGLIPELVGRVPVTVSLEMLDHDALIRILTEPKNAIVKQYQKLLELDGVKLVFDDSALNEIADISLKRKTGARGLRAIMENTMVWERALSLRNPWIQQMEQYKTPEALDRNFVKKYIEQVVVTFLGDKQAEISLTMKTQEWKQMLERIELEGTDNGTKK